MNRVNRLREFIDRYTHKKVVWGESDCTMVSCAWVEQELDVTLPKEHYSSKREAYHLIRQAGGLDQIWMSSLRRFARRSIILNPQYGDVGLIETANQGLAGVIFVYDCMCICRCDDGFKILSPRRKAINSVWHIPDIH